MIKQNDSGESVVAEVFEIGVFTIYDICKQSNDLM